MAKDDNNFELDPALSDAMGRIGSGHPWCFTLFIHVGWLRPGLGGRGWWSTWRWIIVNGHNQLAGSGFGLASSGLDSIDKYEIFHLKLIFRGYSRTSK